ncbi:MAG: LysR family transcriptional regulator, partial [Pseudomonadota bacterium]
MDWNNVKAFVAVVRAGSISEAARSAGMSIATLSRRIDQLEHATSLKLLLRSSSGVTVTQEGASFYRATRDAQTAMDTVQRVARSLKAREAELPVRVSATETVITTLLAPRLAALKSFEHAPRIDLLVSYENADLSKREADMAIRLAAPVQETLVARKLGTIHSQLYASNDYFARHNPT